MTSDIQIGKYTIKPTAVKWKCSVLNFVDTCTIQLPRTVYMPNNTDNTETPDSFKKLRFMPFNEGDAVTVKLGYNNDNNTVFKGFVKRINQTMPLSLECEGYSYQLNNIYFTKSYQRTTAKQLLQDLTAGTDIKLSEFIADVSFSNVSFKNTPGIKVLEWLQKELLMTVFFDFENLYAGAAKYGVPKPTAKLLLGWNTVNDDNFKKNTEQTIVNIQVVSKNPAGSVKKTKSENRRYSATKEVKIRSGLPDTYVKTVTNELQRQENYKGYKGSITCFLQPHFEKGYVADIDDKRYPDRKGLFFVETIEGSFDKGGGRQKITVNYFGNVD